MADILSQNEVDALLSAINTDGEDTEDTVKSEEKVLAPDEQIDEADISKYDFRRPDIVSKDQLRTLQMLHKTFCRYLTTNLSTYLRTIVDVNLVAVDQLTYGEFNMSLSNPTSINVFSMNPLEGKNVLEINPVLIHSIIDRLLGGIGEPPAVIKPLTDIEQSIVAKVIDIVLGGLRESWKNIVEFNFVVEDTETNPQFVQIVAPGETVILISCEMKVGNISGIMSVCFPFLYIEPIMTSLSASHWISSTQKEPTKEMKESIQGSLNSSSLGLKVDLGRAMIKIKQLVKLQRGDVIILDKKVNSNLEIYLKNKKKFLGKPGIHGKKKSVKIVSILTNKKEG